jgi:hypothetical protein
MATTEANGSWKREALQKLAKENRQLGVDVWKLLEGDCEGKIDPTIGGCKYHEHGEDESCQNKGGKRKLKEMLEGENNGLEREEIDINKKKPDSINLISIKFVFCIYI